MRSLFGVGVMVLLAGPVGPTATAVASKQPGVRNGEYRTYYASGRPFELRHFKDGHEEGVQQAWTEEGTLYINYEVRGGRRYGLLNSTPCVEAENRTSAVPYYDGPEFTAKWTPVAHRVAPFSLTTQTGAAISNRSLAGRIHVASFIYTKCAAVCPILVSQLTRVQRALTAIPDAKIVSYSVTPDEDTPAALAAFGRSRSVDPARWSLVTGDRRQIYRLARESYFADDDRVGPAAGDGDERFLHTEKVLLVDGDGHLRGVYNGTQPHEIDQLIADLKSLARDAS
jgi:protein SCO1/2